jgi:hypothetical protein
MQTNSILLENLSVEQLQEMIDSSVKNGIQNHQKEFQNKNEQEELLTREETCKFLKIDSSTLWSWTNQGKVIAHGISSRRYYLRTELLQSLTLLKK